MPRENSLDTRGMPGRVLCRMLASLVSEFSAVLRSSVPLLSGQLEEVGLPKILWRVWITGQVIIRAQYELLLTVGESSR